MQVLNNTENHTMLCKKNGIQVSPSKKSGPKSAMMYSFATVFVFSYYFILPLILLTSYLMPSLLSLTCLSPQVTHYLSHSPLTLHRPQISPSSLPSSLYLSAFIGRHSFRGLDVLSSCDAVYGWRRIISPKDGVSHHPCLII